MYVAGGTESTDFPTRDAYQATYGGGDEDAFLSGLSFTTPSPSPTPSVSPTPATKRRRHQ